MLLDEIILPIPGQVIIEAVVEKEKCQSCVRVVFPASGDDDENVVESAWLIGNVAIAIAPQMAESLALSHPHLSQKHVGWAK